MRAVFVLVALAAPALAPAEEYSALWGKQGEKWSAASRLPDFSFAGYRCGEQALPTVERGKSVKDFGAKGDGASDDTEAFLRAIKATERGAIEVPPGRYWITNILEITRSGVVLRGAGPEKSILLFTKPLQEIKPNWGATTSGRPTSNYSWSGGFVWVRGELRQRTLAQVTAAAERGEKSLQVSSMQDLAAGTRIEVFQRDTRDNSLAIHLYSEDAGQTSKLLGRTHTSLVCRVVKVEGKTIHLDRSLRCDVHPRWSPVVRSFEPSVSEVGVEGLGFEFPNTPYQGHFTELGFNALAFSQVADCWARDLRIANADSGIFPGGNFCTIQRVVFESARRRDSSGSTGHHGIYFGRDDNLFTDFDIRTRFIHDLSVSHCTGNVCSCGRGEDLCFDHHKRAPYENLFTDIDAGAGTHLWRCGGGDALGKNCGARGTFWNIRARKPLAYPPASFGPWSLNLVAVQGAGPSQTGEKGKWLEAIVPEQLGPQNLHQAQLQRRLKGPSGAP